MKCLPSVLIWIVAGTLLVGCEQERPNSSTSHQWSATELETLNDAIGEVLAADDRLEQAVAAWPIVLQHEETAEISQTDTDAPVSMLMTLASSAEGWSVCEATRKNVPGTSPDTIRIELATFAFRLPWFPTKEAYPLWVNSDDDSGATELLEWKIEDLGDSTAQRLQLSFRLRSNR